jgi:hypothetical protein
LLWRSEDDQTSFDLYIGTLDEKYLIGVEEAKPVDEVAGAGKTLKDGWGKLLCTPNGTQFWCENAIAGVTNLLKGGVEFPREGN